MKFHTKSFAIGEEIEPPKDAFRPMVSIHVDSDIGPLAVLTYIELSPDEKRELQAQQLRQNGRLA